MEQTTSKRPELGTLVKDQSVMVHLSPNDKRGRTPEDRVVPARVVTVGRVWTTLERVGDGFPNQWRMRLDTQDEGKQNYSMLNARFVTVEQRRWEVTRQWALGVIQENGLHLERGSTWDGREVELANLLITAPRS